MESNYASGPKQARGCAKKALRVGLMNENVSADHAIEGCGAGERFNGGLNEAHLIEPGFARALLRHRDNLRTAVEADDGSRGSDKLRSQKGNVTGAAT